MVLALVDDLLLGSKIRAAAQSLDQPIRFVRGRTPVVVEIRQHQPSLVIIDLNREAPDTMDAIRSIKAAPDLASIRLIAFVAHTNTDLIKAAREAGIDTVLARSAFFSSLPQILAPKDLSPAQ